MAVAYVTLGAQRYKVERAWTQADITSITSVVVLADGRIAALLRRPACVLVLAPDGQVSTRWSLEDILCPHHISARPQGGVLVTDLDGHQVLALDAQGHEQWRLGKPEQPRWQEPFNHPTHAVECADGGLWVTDGYGNTVVHRFDPQRQWLAALGAPGSGPLQFSTPHMLACAADGSVWVADRETTESSIWMRKAVIWASCAPCTNPWPWPCKQMVRYWLVTKQPVCLYSTRTQAPW